MSTAIAEFYAKITANTDEAQKSLKDFDGKLTKTAATAKQSGGVMEGLKGHIASLVNPTTLAIGAFTAITGTLAKSYGTFQQYAGSVRDIALASGTSAEEASRLIQVLDDYEISAGDVLAATKAMTKNGMEPSIDTLAQLADEYVKINDPMQQNAFLMEHLGKAGLQWANALSQGGDALRAQSGEVSKSLILTDEQIKKSEQARLAMDALGDAWEGVKVSIGSAIGELIAANATLGDQKKQYEELTGTTLNFSRAQDDATKNFEAFQAQMKRGAAATEFYKAQMEGATGANEEYSVSLEELSQANANIINDAIDIQDSTNEYQASQAEIAAQIDELTAKKAAMSASEKDELAKITEQIDGLKEKYAEGADAFEEAQQRKLVTMALEQIALSDGVAGYSEAEAAKAEAILATADIAEAAAFRQARAFEATASAIADGTMKAEDMQAVLEEMAKGYTVEVAVNVVERGYAGYGAGASYATGDLQYQNPQTQAVNGNWAGGDVGRGAGIPWLARGGSAGIGIVGDRQGGGWVDGVSELVFGDFTVVPSAKSKKMLQSGMFGRVPGFAGGTPSARGRKPWGSTLGGGTSDSDGGSLSEAPPEIFQTISHIETSQNATEQVVTQTFIAIQSQIQQLAQQSAMESKQTLNAFKEMISVMRNEAPVRTGQEVGYIVASAVKQ